MRPVVAEWQRLVGGAVAGLAFSDIAECPVAGLPERRRPRSGWPSAIPRACSRAAGSQNSPPWPVLTRYSLGSPSAAAPRRPRSRRGLVVGTMGPCRRQFDRRPARMPSLLPGLGQVDQRDRRGRSSVATGVAGPQPGRWPRTRVSRVGVEVHREVELQPCHRDSGRTSARSRRQLRPLAMAILADQPALAMAPRMHSVRLPGGNCARWPRGPSSVGSRRTPGYDGRGIDTNNRLPEL